MNPEDPGPPSSPLVPSETYKDRSTGLVVFGILTILLGCLVGLMMAATAAQAVVGRTNQGISLWMVLPVVATYGLLAMGLVWLGIGSILKQRWARALLLVFSWSWLVIGIVSILALSVILPTTLANIRAGAANSPMSAEAMAVVLVTTYVMMGVGFILLPSIWAYFYSRPNVKATCEARDPKRRWTDECPLPVLAISLFMAFSAPMMVLVAFTGHAVMPAFGGFLTGIWGAAACLVMAGVWLYLAWLLFKLKSAGWWALLIILCLVSVSSLITFTRHDIAELYRLMNYPSSQVEEMQRIGWGGNALLWMSALFMLPLLGFLAYIKKFFKPAQ